MLQNPRVGLLFLVPGRNETLRVNGRAMIVRDAELRETHDYERQARRSSRSSSRLRKCSCIAASACCARRLWDREARTDVTGLPSHARCLVDHAGLAQPLEAVEASVREGNKNKLY